MIAEQVTGPVAYHGEGPIWSHRWGGLRWVDMLAGDVLFLGRDGSIERRHVGTVAAVLRPRRAGGAVIGVERGFALEDGDGSLTYMDELWTDSNLRMNEGGCDPDGRFYCGSMAYDGRVGAGTGYRLEPDGSVHVVLTGVTISNGIDWSPDGAVAYYNDTATHRTDVVAYDRQNGFGASRCFVETPGMNPDGLTVDAAGGVWVAYFGSSQVRRYDPDGMLDVIVDVPARQVTACTFGGPDLDDLFITTSRENLAPDDDPLAGSLFRADVGSTGLPAREFAG